MQRVAHSRRAPNDNGKTGILKETIEIGKVFALSRHDVALSRGIVLVFIFWQLDDETRN